jgi:hypothetical protein
VRPAPKLPPACISLRDNGATAFKAAQLGCAYLGHVEMLEAAAKRANRSMVRTPVTRYV